MSAKLSGLFESSILVFLLSAALTSSVAADKGKPMLSLEEIVGLRSVSGAWISPDADLIAYLLSVPRVVYRDADGPAAGG